MTNYTITKENGITKISASAKTEVSTIVTEALITAYGAKNVAIVRTGGSSPSNVLAVRVGTLTDESGFEYDICVTLDATVKSYKERVTKRYTVEAFDFDACREAYEDYLTDKATKKAEAEAKKAECKAKGSKSKAEKDAEKAKKSAELDEASARVEAKRKAETEETKSPQTALFHISAFAKSVPVRNNARLARIYPSAVCRNVRNALLRQFLVKHIFILHNIPMP